MYRNVVVCITSMTFVNARAMKLELVSCLLHLDSNTLACDAPALFKFQFLLVSVASAPFLLSLQIRLELKDYSYEHGKYFQSLRTHTYSLLPLFQGSIDRNALSKY